ncbi:MAG: AAA family ATPase [Phaeospirillum sp.]|nr:AAA family ATPase [Phaeospirillum sp.]
MARAIRIGPHILALIEDARIDLARAVLAVREGENEPDFGLPAEAPDPTDDEAVDAFRHDLIQTLSAFDPDELRPAEQRSRRILALAEGKGIDSLTAIAEQQFAEEQSIEFDRQPDQLCRSIWAFLNARQTFEDAESFHFARKFRDYGKLYDAFEVELEKAINLDSGTIDEAALATKITKVLQLKTACTVKALDLPATTAHPASIMLIVRHGGPLSSVHDHRNDGRRGTIYYRPPNEAIQIAHTEIKRFDSPEHEPYDRYIIKLHARAAALMQEHSDAVLFANYRISTVKSDVGFNKKVTRALGSGERVLYTAERPAFLAKNRYGLPDVLPLSWEAVLGIGLEGGVDGLDGGRRAGRQGGHHAAPPRRRWASSITFAQPPSSQPSRKMAISVSFSASLRPGRRAIRTAISAASRWRWRNAVRARWYQRASIRLPPT